MIPIRSFVTACLAVIMLATIASAQCANCSSSVLNDPCSAASAVIVGEPVVTSVTYRESIVASTAFSNLRCSNGVLSKSCARRARRRQKVRTNLSRLFRQRSGPNFCG